MSLIQEYAKLFDSNREALDHLNEMFNTNFAINRFSEWGRKNNGRPLPAHIAEPLRMFMLPLVLEDENILVPPEKMKIIIDKLSID